MLGHGHEISSVRLLRLRLCTPRLSLKGSFFKFSLNVWCQRKHKLHPLFPLRKNCCWLPVKKRRCHQPFKHIQPGSTPRLNNILERREQMTIRCLFCSCTNPPFQWNLEAMEILLWWIPHVCSISQALSQPFKQSLKITSTQTHYPMSEAAWR